MATRTRSMLIAGACAVLALAGAAACGSGGQSAPSKTIGLAIADQTSQFFIAAAAGVQDYAKENGYQVRVVSADDDSTKQVSQVQTLLTQNVGALVYVPAGAAAADVPVNAANRANVPVVTIDRQPSPESKLVSFIATDSTKAAKQICQLMIDSIHRAGEIGIIQGQLGTTPQEARQQGCQQALSASPGVKVVAQQAANWDQNQGYQVAQNMLAGHPNLVAIFGQSDAMALGAAKAAQDAGRKLTIIGIDGFPDMYKAIEQGTVTATMGQQPYAMGRLAAQNAIAAVQGKGAGIPRTQYLDAPMVTKQNVADVAKRNYYGPLGP